MCFDSMRRTFHSSTAAQAAWHPERLFEKGGGQVRR
jgi:hypothetical protein